MCSLATATLAVRNNGAHSDATFVESGHPVRKQRGNSTKAGPISNELIAFSQAHIRNTAFKVGRPAFAGVSAKCPTGNCNFRKRWRRFRRCEQGQ